ncbi:MAG: DUF5689 domain-containing protein [bacterium]
MKTNIKLALVAIAVIFITSCENRYAEPEYIIPSYELDTTKFTLMTIEELKALHTSGNVPDQAPDSAVIRGIVIGDDRSGNLYKSIYIQDETGAINLSIDKTNLYNILPVGQEVYVELKGLFVGDYVGLFQLGDTCTDATYGLEISRYDWGREYLVDEDGNSLKRFYTNGLPDDSQLPTPLEITSSNSITSDMYCSLATLQNITFAEGGTATWSASEETINKYATFEDGSTIAVRTSGYSNFYADTIPTGTGNLTGIIAVFNSTIQFYIRDRDDIDF